MTAGTATESRARALAELEDRLRRALADLDNLRKRYDARAASSARADERAAWSSEWLPVVDNLERALGHADAEAERARRGRASRARPGGRRARPARLPPLRRRRASRSTRRGTRRSARSTPTTPTGHRRRRSCGPATARASDPAAGRGRGRRRGGSDGHARRDFYEVLGVRATATTDEIQRGLPQAGPPVPPGRQQGPGAEERFKEISEAYDVLSDPETRRRYDAFGHDFRQVPDDVDPETVARAAQGGRHAAATAATGRRRTARVRRRTTSATTSSGGTSTSTTCSAGSSVGAVAAGAGPGADQEAELDAHVEEAYRGGHRTITLAGPDGPRTLRGQHPAGVTDGQRIRLAGQGGRGSGGAPPGDLYLVVRIAPAPALPGRGPRHLPSTCRWRHGRPRSARRSPVDTPGGEAKVHGARRARRAAAAAAAGPRHARTPRASPATSTPRCGSWCRRRCSDDERELFEELAARLDFDPRRQR